MHIKYLIAGLAAATTNVVALPAPDAMPEAAAVAVDAIDPPELPADIEARQVQDLTWNADHVPENNRWFQAFDRWYLNNNFGNDRRRWQRFERNWDSWNRINNRRYRRCSWGWGYC